MVPYYSGIHVVTIASGLLRGIERVLLEVPIVRPILVLLSLGGIDTVLGAPLVLGFKLFGFATVLCFGALVPLLALDVFGLNGGISGTE